MSTLRPPTPLDTLRLLALGAIWGSAFLCIDIALTGFGPLSVAAGRIALAALALGLVIGLRGRTLPRSPQVWGILALVGLFSSALPFWLISWGQQTIDGGLTAILMASGPFVALGLAHLTAPDDRLSLPKVAGMGLGFIGVVILVGLEVLDGAGGTVLAQLSVIAAATCYPVAGVLIRRVAWVPPLESSVVVLITASAYMLPLALVLERPWPVAAPPPALAALVFLGLVPTALAYLLRFQLIQQVGISFIAQVSYLVPLFAVLWVWLLLGQAPPPRAWLALGLILAGVYVSRCARLGLPGRVRGSETSAAESLPPGARDRNAGPPLR